MKEKEKSSRFKPPRWPPTAVGTAPESGGPAPISAVKRIIAFAGKAKPIGKSTLALNLASLIAASEQRSVVIISFDRASSLWMREVTNQEALSLSEIDCDSVLPRSEPGISVVECTLGHIANPTLPPRIAKKIEMIGETYHVVLDTDEASSNLGILTLADRICWVTTPEIMNSDEIDRICSSPDPDPRRHIIALNRVESKAPGIIQRFDLSPQRERTVLFPEQSDVKKAGDEKRLFIREGVSSPWLQSLMSLLAKCT